MVCITRIPRYTACVWFKRRKEQLDWLVFGLGNPGINYAGTRHNVGWWVLDELTRRWGHSRQAHRHHGQADYTSHAGQSVALVKPTTFMNRSGRCVRAWLNEFPEAGWLVVADDITMQAGRLRLRENGSAGGHNGLKSIIDSTGSKAFLRLKLGVGQPPPDVDAADYVLEKPSRQDEDQISLAVAACADAVTALLSGGEGAARDVIARYSQPRRTDADDRAGRISEQDTDEPEG